MIGISLQQRSFVQSQGHVDLAAHSEHLLRRQLNRIHGQTFCDGVCGRSKANPNAIRVLQCDHGPSLTSLLTGKTSRKLYRYTFISAVTSSQAVDLLRMYIRSKKDQYQKSKYLFGLLLRSIRAESACYKVVSHKIVLILCRRDTVILHAQKLAIGLTGKGMGHTAKRAAQDSWELRLVHIKYKFPNILQALV